jgi:hypothetical protein
LNATVPAIDPVVLLSTEVSDGTVADGAGAAVPSAGLSDLLQPVHRSVRSIAEK